MHLLSQRVYALLLLQVHSDLRHLWAPIQLTLRQPYFLGYGLVPCHSKGVKKDRVRLAQDYFLLIGIVPGIGLQH